MTTHFIADIDGVLACAEVLNHFQANFFREHGAVITAMRTHYLFPGVIEFTKWLFDRGKVSYFSSACQERNEPFVQKLLQLCDKEDAHPLVLSRNDLTSPTQEEKTARYEKYHIDMVEIQKDITKALDEGEDLENAVIFEDQPAFVAFDQVKNCLYVPPSDYLSFYALPRGRKVVYQPNGYRLFSCVFSQRIEGTPPPKRRKIFIMSTAEEMKIGFFDSSHQYQEKVIETPKLLAQLQRYCNKNEGVQIRDEKLIKKICALVKEWGGVTKKVCRKANRIFYATGLISYVLKMSQRTQKPISECLFKLQFKEKRDGCYTTRFKKLCKNERFYLLGLKELRKYNDNLQLVTPCRQQMTRISPKFLNFRGSGDLG